MTCMATEAKDADILQVLLGDARAGKFGQEAPSEVNGLRKPKLRLAGIF
jgi:hypothetical protein